MVSSYDDILIFDRKLLRQKRQRARANLKAHEFLHEWAAGQLADRLADIRRDFPIALELGPRCLSLLDNPQAAAKNIRSKIHMDTGGYDAVQSGALLVAGDEEFLPFKDASFDLVLSSLNLHNTNDLPGTLIQIRRILKPDGLFLAALFGGETLYELRSSLMSTEISLRNGASPRVFPFADKPQMGALMQRAGFALPVIDSDIVTVTYETMYGLLRDLRGMGEGNIIRRRDKTYPGRDFFSAAAAHYQNNYQEENGLVRASFEIIFLIGWAPHASQQRPMTPGSAEKRLSEALGTEEIKAGDIAQ